MHTRAYMKDMVGGHGNVMSHHKTIKDLEQYYRSMGLDNKDVETFLQNVTSDKEGYDPVSPHFFLAYISVFSIVAYFSASRILHLFPWSGIVDEESQLSDTFRVPDPKTGQMRRLISQIPEKEEEMFRNMIRRVNTIVKV